MSPCASNLDAREQVGVAAPAALVTPSIDAGRAIERRRGVAHAVLCSIRSACMRVEVWIGRVRERRLLAQLSERELRDIGLTRYDALYEWRKPFWRE